MKELYKKVFSCFTEGEVPDDAIDWYLKTGDPIPLQEWIHPNLREEVSWMTAISIIDSADGIIKDAIDNKNIKNPNENTIRAKPIAIGVNQHYESPIKPPSKLSIIGGGLVGHKSLFSHFSDNDIIVVEMDKYMMETDPIKNEDVFKLLIHDSFHPMTRISIKDLNKPTNYIDGKRKPRKKKRKR